MLVYSTYLGGTSNDFGQGIAVDAAGNAYVTGYTNSTDFPAAGTPSQAAHGGGQDAFVTKLDPTSALVYSTYLGGNNLDFGQGIAVDAAGNAYVIGYTYSTNFPTAGTPSQPAYAGNIDAFVTKLGPTSALIYSTYLGGNSSDLGFGIAVDAAGNAYVTGYTVSANFPTAGTPSQPANAGGVNAFVTRLGPTSALIYSTYLGGSGGGGDFGLGIALDALGNAYVTGYTYSADFPTAGTPSQPANAGSTDAFVTKLGPTSVLIYSTYLGGNSSDFGLGIAVDGAENAYVTGYTVSANFPTAGTPSQPANAGSTDAFVTKLGPTSILIYSTYLGGSDQDVGTGIALDALGNAYVTGSHGFHQLPYGGDPLRQTALASTPS